MTPCRREQTLLQSSNSPRRIIHLLALKPRLVMWSPPRLSSSHSSKPPPFPNFSGPIKPVLALSLTLQSPASAASWIKVLNYSCRMSRNSSHSRRVAPTAIILHRPSATKFPALPIVPRHTLLRPSYSRTDGMPSPAPPQPISQLSKRDVTQTASTLRRASAPRRGRRCSGAPTPAERTHFPTKDPRAGKSVPAIYYPRPSTTNGWI